MDEVLLAGLSNRVTYFPIKLDSGCAQTDDFNRFNFPGGHQQ